MSARWFTFLVWAAVAASAVAWGLKVFVSPLAAAAPAPVAAAGAAAVSDVSRVLGAEKAVAPVAVAPEAAAAPTDARFQLLGVVAPRGAGSGRSAVALIAVEGKTARAYRTGAVVDREWVVQNVRARSVDLGPARKGAKASVTLELPPLAAPATGQPLAFAPGAGAATGTPAPPPMALSPNPSPAVPTPPMPSTRSALPVRMQAPSAAGPNSGPNSGAKAGDSSTMAPTRNGLPKPPPGDGGMGQPPMQAPSQVPGAALQ